MWTDAIKYFLFESAISYPGPIQMQLKKKCLSSHELYKLEILDCLQLCHINSYLLQTRPTLCALPFQNTSLNPLLRQHFFACPIVIATNEPPIANVSVAVKFSSFTGTTNLPGASLRRPSELHGPVKAHICQWCRPDTHVNKVVCFFYTCKHARDFFIFCLFWMSSLTSLNFSYFQGFLLSGVPPCSALEWLTFLHCKKLMQKTEM